MNNFIVVPWKKTPKSKNWKDEDIDLFPGVSYTTIKSSTILRRIGENWFIMLYNSSCHDDISESRYRLAKMTTLLALHLKAPDLKTNLCRPNDQKEPNSPEKINLDELTSTEELERMEEITGRKEISQWVCEKTETIGNLVLEKESLVKRVTYGPSASQLEQAADRHMIASTIGSNCKDVINIFRAEPVEKAAAFYCFAAAVASRLMVKGETQIAIAFSRDMPKRFCQFYGRPNRSFSVPPPNITALKNIKFRLEPQPNISLRIGLLKGFLKALRRADVTSGEEKSILDYTLLRDTSMNGLHLVNLMMQTKEKIKAENFEHVLEKVDCVGNLKTIGLLRDFIKEYLLDTEEEASRYVFWARLFDDAYFFSLRLKDNSFLAATFIAIIQDDPEDGMWKMPGLQITKAGKECILEHMNRWKQRM